MFCYLFSPRVPEVFGPFVPVKGQFRELTNHHNERNNTVLTDYSMADELKPTNSVSKNGRRMRY